MGMAGEKLQHRFLQGACTNAMNYPNFTMLGQDSLVQELIDLFEPFLDAEASDLKLVWGRAGGASFEFRFSSFEFRLAEASTLASGWTPPLAAVMLE